MALAAGLRGLVKRTTRPFQALAPVVAMGILVVGGLLVENTEDWRKAIFALMLFSVVVGLPEGLMGFLSIFLAKLFRVPHAPLPVPTDIETLLPPRAADGSPLLVLEDLKRHFGGVKAVDGISLTIRSGTIHGLIGPNGSGKSTVVNVISGLYPPSSGRILLRGAALPSGSLYQVSKSGVARTFQNLQLFGGAHGPGERHGGPEGGLPQSAPPGAAGVGPPGGTAGPGRRPLPCSTASA